MNIVPSSGATAGVNAPLSNGGDSAKKSDQVGFEEKYNQTKSEGRSVRATNLSSQVSASDSSEHLEANDSDSSLASFDVKVSSSSRAMPTVKADKNHDDLVNKTIRSIAGGRFGDAKNQFVELAGLAGVVEQKDRYCLFREIVESTKNYDDLVNKTIRLIAGGRFGDAKNQFVELAGVFEQKDRDCLFREVVKSAPKNKEEAHELLRFMKDRGCNVRALSDSYLVSVAAKNNDVETMAFLVDELGADLGSNHDQKNNQFPVPLREAAVNGNIKALEFLLERVVTPNISLALYGNWANDTSPLTQTTQAYLYYKHNMLEEKIDGKKVDLRLLSDNLYKCIELLLRAKADPNHLDAKYTLVPAPPLMQAFYNRNEELMELLVDHGARIPCEYRLVNDHGINNENKDEFYNTINKYIKDSKEKVEIPASLPEYVNHVYYGGKFGSEGFSRISPVARMAEN